MLEEPSDTKVNQIKVTAGCNHNIAGFKVAKMIGGFLACKVLQNGACLISNT